MKKQRKEKIKKLSREQRKVFETLIELQKRLSEIDMEIALAERDLMRNRNIKAQIEHEIKENERELFGK